MILTAAELNSHKEGYECGGGWDAYLHPAYAEACSDLGQPLHLPNSGAWILKRRIPNTPYLDGMGCYPILSCKHWSSLPADFENIEGELISLSAVTDPFGKYDLDLLRRCFNNVAIPYKEHFIIDLSRSPDSFVCEHHRRHARKALKSLSVDKCEDPIQFIHEWVSLYNNLIHRHGISGIQAFSKEAFTKQFQVPGMVAFRAVYDNATVGMTLWYVQGCVGYYHLAAYSPAGYELRASFALFWTAIRYFAANGLHWLSLGAGAGLRSSGTDGLSRFKKGWSTGTRTAYFCGRILNHAKYTELTGANKERTSEYFPAYRYNGCSG